MHNDPKPSDLDWVVEPEEAPSTPVDPAPLPPPGPSPPLPPVIITPAHDVPDDHPFDPPG